MAAGETPSSADARAIEEQLARIVASPELSGAARLCAFLEFVVRRTLAGQSGEIKEYIIGTAVFDRPDSFDPRVDTIVRVQASKLRTRLAEYYLTAGVNDPIVIELPRGSYVPIFRATTSPAMSGESPATRAETARQWIRRGARAWIIPALAAGCLIALAGIYLLRTRPRAPVKEEGIQFTVLPPENFRFYAAPKISPDGRYLLSIVTDPLGRTALWLRPLAAVSGQVLPGTEGAAFTFWSENGRTALFVGAGKRLNQIDIAKPGPPHTVVLPIMGFGAAFSRDGFLLMAREGAGIARVELTGGALSMLTALDGSHQEISHYWPEFLPDGGHFLYFAHSRNPAEHAIYASSLNGNRRKRLLTSESQAQYAPAGQNASSGAGYLLYVRERTLFAQAFDPESWQLAGDPKAVVQDNVLQIPYSKAAFSASATGVLVYRSDISEGGQFTWFDRAGKQLGTIAPPGWCGDPAISPNGKLVAFDFTDGPNRDVWTTDVATGHTRRLTFDPEVDHVPVWSPDGGRVVFDSHRGSLGSLYVKALSGASSETRLLTWPERIAAEDWSRDGAFLAFTSFSNDGNIDIWILPLQPASKPFPYLQTKGRELQPKFSPDRRWMAYVSDQSGRDEVYVQAFDGTSAASGGKWLISSDGGSQPAWRADGRELYFLAPDHKLMVVDVNTKGTFTSGRPRTLFAVSRLSREGPRNSYAASSDGQRFLVRLVWQRNPPGPIHVFVNWAAALRK